MNWFFFYEKRESSGGHGWDEPVSSFTIIVVILGLLAVSLMTGISEWVLKHFSVISWIVMLVFLAVAILEARANFPRSRLAFAIICMVISQLSYGFFALLTLRDLALVGRQGLAGLIGVVILVPFYALGFVICRLPNVLSRDYSDEIWAPILDAVATPGLIALACWIFGFYDSVPRVWQALFGG